MRSSSSGGDNGVVENALSPAYPYTPLSENLLDGNHHHHHQEQRDHSSNSQIEDSATNKTAAGGAAGGECTPLEIACAKVGLWDLRYKQEATSSEFMRFCHRGLEGVCVTAPMSIFASLALLNTEDHFLNDYDGFVGLMLLICVLSEIIVHCVKRAGTAFTYKVALLRQGMHIAQAVVICLLTSWHHRLQQVECRQPDQPDPLYQLLHGPGQVPSRRTQLITCYRTISPHSVVGMLMVFCTLRLDIYVHFGMTMLHFTLQVIGLFALAPLVEAPDGIIYRPDSTEMAIRVLVALLSGIVSNLVAFGKHRSLQRSFEAALDVHYQMRASRRRMEAVDSLLSSMVPPSALVRLLEGEQVHDRSPIASVLFSDMVHFTLWSSKRTPSDVVSMLSVLVRELDVLAADMGVSKVKTIGDCYWAVTGIPSQVKLHAEVMIHFALAMLALVRKEAKAHVDWDYPGGNANLGRRPILFRTGIHSGPVQGGVLGTQQISYEIFGETSNAANQVEAKGVADSVCVSHLTKRLAEEETEEPLLFHFVPLEEAEALIIPQHSPSSSTATVVDDSDGLEVIDGECSLFLVVSHDDEENDRVSLNSQISMSGVGAGGGGGGSSAASRAGQKDESERGKEQRRRYVEKHVLKGGDLNVMGEGNRESLVASLSRREYCCWSLRFVNSDLELQFQEFAVLAQRGLRLGGAVVMVCVGFFFLAMVLADAQGPISPATVVLSIVGICCFTASAALQRRSQQQESQGKAEQLRFSKVAPILSEVGSVSFLVAALFTADSILTNSVIWFVPFTLLVVIPNAPDSMAPFVLSTDVVILINMRQKSSSLSQSFFALLGGSLTAFLLSYVMEKRLRVQFVEEKVAAHFAAQQVVALRAQESVLTSMLPDFVIEPLSAWLASDFDPLKAVVRDCTDISVAFLRLSAGAESLKDVKTAGKRRSSRLPMMFGLNGDQVLPEDDPQDDNNSQQRRKLEDMTWLFAAHRAVDEVLSSSLNDAVVDKVKTVGDLVIVAGSFRGHPSAIAAAVMLQLMIKVHRLFGREDSEGAITIGLHVGPVMGIVLGFSRLAFDIFGDTVNTASRVMSNPNTKNKICASTDFLGLLPSLPVSSDDVAIDYGPVCEIAAKGKGHLTVREVQHSLVQKEDITEA